MDSGAAARLEGQLGSGIAAVYRMGGQHGVTHYRLELKDGRAAFAKVAAGASATAGAGSGRQDGPAGPGFAAEASSLRWLAAAGAVAVPAVLGCDDAILAIDWIEPGAADGRAALRFGRELAALHAAGADAFGAPWPGVIAGLPLSNRALSNRALSNRALSNRALVNRAQVNRAQPDGAGAGWPEWYAGARVLPYVRLARDAGALTAADARVVESAAGRAAEVAGPAEPPARIHGDCWSGNVLWSGGRGWLVDPAAHGGHRETDLAMLALFGAPYLDRIMAGYQEAAPLADGWLGRVPLHQLHPLLVHVCLFGATYTEPTLAAAKAVLAM